MLPFNNHNICPGPSSQTTYVSVKNLVVRDTLNLGLFDTNSPVIQSPKSNKWEETAREVLQEYAELWEKLSEL